jgi:hypothetical protein
MSISALHRAAVHFAFALSLAAVAPAGQAVAASQSVLQRLTDFNVLRSAYVDPATGNVTLVGTNDPSYASGPIPYDALLADALSNPYPSFSLVYDPKDASLRKIEQTMLKELNRVKRDQNYGISWIKQMMLSASKSGTDDQRILEQRLSVLGIPPKLFAEFLAWKGESGLSNNRFRDDMGLVYGKILAGVGIPEDIGRAVVEIKAAYGKNAKRAPDDPETIGDKTYTIFVHLGIEDEYHRIQEAYWAHRLNDASATTEIVSAIYRGLLRGLLVPEAEVTQLIRRYRATGSETALLKKQQERFGQLSGASLSKHIFHGFHFSGGYLEKIYSLPRLKSGVNLFGARPDSPIMRAFYDGDITLKSVTESPFRAQVVKGAKSFEEFLCAEADKAGDAAGTLPSTGTIRFWLHPGKVQMSAFSDGSGVRFGSAAVVIGAEPLERAQGGDRRGTAFFGRALDSYGKQLTGDYDAYAHAFPALHVVRETEKVIALARWLKSRQIAARLPETKMTWSPVPKSAEGFWGMTYIARSRGSNDDLFITVDGGVSFSPEEGDGWIDVAPSAAATNDTFRQLVASAALAGQAADAALNGRLEAARDLAEQSAEAMTGAIDVRPPPAVVMPSGDVPLAARMDVGRAALSAVDRNIAAISAAEDSRASAEAQQATTPEQYALAVEASERVRTHCEQNLRKLQELMAEYGLARLSPSATVIGLAQLDPSPPPIAKPPAGGGPVAAPGGPTLPDAKLNAQLVEMTAAEARLAAKIPPPIPASTVSLQWKSLTTEEQIDAITDKIGLLVISCQVLGTIGPSGTLAVDLTFIAGKTLAAGVDTAFVHVEQRNDLIDAGLGYLKDKATAQRFIEVMRRLKSGKGIVGTDYFMVPAAKAMLDPDLSAGNNVQILWDSMMTQDVWMAMLRKAAIEGFATTAANVIGEKTKELAADVARRRDIYSEARLLRTKATHWLKDYDDPEIKAFAQRSIHTSNATLKTLYGLNVVLPEALATYVSGKFISAFLDKQWTNEDDD